ncbi:MAG: adenosylcobinamide-phosphate synthase CbiB [Selenomonadaceae bacterium]|nr:adenosylcobinamide-phosphate synthase CbiB [Selenomonadaceae bacterium]
MITAILGFIADTLIGDPRSKLHPVVLIGQLIAGLEKLFYRETQSSRQKLVSGGILAMLVMVLTYEIVNAIELLLQNISNKYVIMAINGFLLSFTISPKSLANAGREIYDYLMVEDLENARCKVGWIVGRDTENLSPQEVSRAAIETVAENTVDGIISPLFFFLIGGLPLVYLYRAINTMDSMLGYKNDRYLYFGRVAARIDDVANYIPARITGIIFVVSAFVLRLNTTNSWKMLRRDASKHPSPNGGWAEASVAGALEIRLGGYNFYFGRETFRAYMGEPLQEMGPQHIMTCIQMMYTATILFLLLAHVVIQLWDNFCMPFLG